MITNVEQRWREGGRSVFVPPSHVVTDLSAYEVAEIHDDTTAREFIVRHHYSRSYVAARERGGLYLRGRLVGVAVASHPMNNAVLASLPCDAAEARELGRLVLAFDGASPFNLASWFLSRWFDLLRAKGIRGLVSFADPVPRTDTAGVTTHVGHVGTVYQGSNAAYDGRGTARKLRLLPDGSVFSDRALSKIRAQERGSRYAEEILVQAGAQPRNGEDPRAWLETQLPRVTRRLTHGGNFRYLIGLDTKMRKAIVKQCEAKYGKMLAYPKIDIAPTTLQPR